MKNCQKLQKFRQNYRKKRKKKKRFAQKQNSSKN